MKINEFSKYVFWGYKPNADIPEDVVTQQVFLYGEIQDMIKLTKKISFTILLKVLKKIKKLGRYKKRVYFIEKIILKL